MTNVRTDLLRDLYRTMVRIRIAEERIADLVEAGEIKCPCHLYIGQEAVAAGMSAPLTKDDYVWGGHRSHGHYLAKGGALNPMMAEIFGKTTGCSEGRGGSMHLFAGEVGILGTVPLVAATIPLAVGAGLAAKLRKDGRVSVAYFGDGATEEGHFHESMNMAALYALPVIFVCENNFYASHMGLMERRRADNIAKSADAHGMPGEAVDGNDIVAMVDVAERAVARARSGCGPTLVEARTFRWRGHVGPAWDMDVGVKRKDELKEWMPRDPIARTRALLVERHVPAETLDAILSEETAAVDASIAFAKRSPSPSGDELTKHVFA